MDILLVNPPMALPTQEMIGVNIEAGASQPPLGLCYLGAKLRQDGHNVTILDAEALSLGKHECVEAILASSPAVVGFTAATPAVKTAARIATAVKTARPKTFIVFGGCHVTSAWQPTMLTFPAIDCCVLGEGEIRFSNLIAALESQSDLGQVRGIVLRYGDKLIKTSAGKRILCLDELPLPAWDLLPEIKTHYQVQFQSRLITPSFSLSTSRGCRGKCRFCPKATFGRKITTHSGFNTFLQVANLHNNHGVKHILFDEDDLLVPHDRVTSFCRHLNESGLQLSWSAFARVDSFDHDLLSVIYEAGCRQLLFGLESGNQTMLDLINKGVKLRQIKRAVEMASDMGIYTKGFFIAGFPGETPRTLEDTKKFMLELPLDDMSLCFFTPFPGAALTRLALNEGTIIDDWDKMNLYQPSYIAKDLSEESLFDWGKECVAEFYGRERIRKTYRKRMETDPDSGAAMVNIFSQLDRLAA